MTGGEHDERERAFHDSWADSVDASSIDVLEAFEHPTAMENAFVLDLLGDLGGLRILDIGSGLGEAAVYFALRGADVTAADLSPRMLGIVTGAARCHGVAVRTMLVQERSHDFGHNQFDVVHAANVLHHAASIPALLDGVHRALRPGGRCVFVDPLKYNPVIWVYRRLAAAVRSPDERPVGFEVFKEMRRRFDGVGHREFWGLSLALFLKFYFVDGLDPSVVRYWKQTTRTAAETLWWWHPLKAIDARLLRMPGLNRLAWNTVYWGTKRRS
jgi:SAM-dependent methyltransferase